MAEERFGSSDRSGREPRNPGRGRGAVTVTLALPRYVSPKQLASGAVGFYWSVPAYWRRQKCPFEAAALGLNLGQAALNEAAAIWNDRFDGWRKEIVTGVGPHTIKFGTIKWLVQEYLSSDVFKERVKERSRPDYDRLFGYIVAMTTTAPKHPTVGDLPINAIDPKAADKLYARFCDGGKYRRGEKAVSYCRTAWAVIRRLYPEQFRTDVPNPWEGVTLKRRQRKIKDFVGREAVYTFAWGAIDVGRPELAAAAVLCFEWLQRPESVIAGGVSWTDYRSRGNPKAVRIEHHKTGEMVQHPLDDDDGEAFYGEAERILAQLPRRGTVMILGPAGQVYKGTRFAQLVRRTAMRLGLPGFTLDACRHGGMTELEEAELTEGQGMALSGHKTPRAYRGYAKLTEERVLAATKRRIAYRRQNAA